MPLAAIARPSPRSRKSAPLADSLILEVAEFETDVLTGIYSEETGKPQPLRISVSVRLAPADRYAPDTPLSASKNYMDLKFAATQALPEGVHFKLIEAVADHICETLFLQDKRVEDARCWRHSRRIWCWCSLRQITHIVVGG